MYSTYNEGESVFPERFIRTLKSKVFKHMAAISKNVYFDVLDDITLFIELLKRNLFTLQKIIKLNTMKILIKKILNLKLVTMLEFQNIKTFC